MTTMGHYEISEPLHERALEIRKKAFGEEHPAVTQSLDNLAAMYRANRAFRGGGNPAQAVHRYLGKGRGA